MSKKFHITELSNERKLLISNETDDDNTYLYAVTKIDKKTDQELTEIFELLGTEKPVFSTENKTIDNNNNIFIGELAMGKGPTSISGGCHCIGYNPPSSRDENNIRIGEDAGKYLSSSDSIIGIGATSNKTNLTMTFTQGNITGTDALNSGSITPGSTSIDVDGSSIQIIQTSDKYIITPPGMTGQCHVMIDKRAIETLPCRWTATWKTSKSDMTTTGLINKLIENGYPIPPFLFKAFSSQRNIADKQKKEETDEQKGKMYDPSKTTLPIYTGDRPLTKGKSKFTACEDSSVKSMAVRLKVSGELPTHRIGLARGSIALEATNTGSLKVDGVKVKVGDKILVAGKHIVDLMSREARIFEVIRTGSLGSQWKLVEKINPMSIRNTHIFVSEGALYSDSGWEINHEGSLNSFGNQVDTVTINKDSITTPLDEEETKKPETKSPLKITQKPKSLIPTVHIKDLPQHKVHMYSRGKIVLEAKNTGSLKINGTKAKIGDMIHVESDKTKLYTVVNTGSMSSQWKILYRKHITVKGKQLNAGEITSGFGNIDVGTNNLEHVTIIAPTCYDIKCKKYGFKRPAMMDKTCPTINLTQQPMIVDGGNITVYSGKLESRDIDFDDPEHQKSSKLDPDVIKTETKTHHVFTHKHNDMLINISKSIMKSKPAKYSVNIQGKGYVMLGRDLNAFLWKHGISPHVNSSSPTMGKIQPSLKDIKFLPKTPTSKEPVVERKLPVKEKVVHINKSGIKYVVRTNNQDVKDITQETSKDGSIIRDGVRYNKLSSKDGSAIIYIQSEYNGGNTMVIVDRVKFDADIFFISEFLRKNNIPIPTFLRRFLNKDGDVLISIDGICYVKIRGRFDKKLYIEYDPRIKNYSKFTTLTFTKNSNIEKKSMTKQELVRTMRDYRMPDFVRRSADL